LNTPMNELPHNQEAEFSLIGSCMVMGDTSVLDTVSPIVSTDDFYSTAAKCMFDALLNLADQNKPLDEIHVMEYLTSKNWLDIVGGLPGITGMLDAATTELQAKHYARIVNEKSNLRKLIRHCRIAQESAENQTDEFLDIRAKLEESMLDIDTKDTSGFGIKDSVKDLMLDLNKMKAGEYVHDVVRTNVGELDSFLGNGGIAAGEVLTLAAPTSCGKSALALYVALKAMTEQGIPVGYFSFEMPQKQILKRMIQSMSGVNFRTIQEGEVNEEQIKRFESSTQKVNDLPLFTSHSVKGADDLVSQARYLVRKKGAKLIVVDYLQLIRFNSNKMSKCEGIANISHRIKQMALELNVPVLLLAQVNREGARRDGGLEIYDLKDSGDIENDADIVMLMWPMHGSVEESRGMDERGTHTKLRYKLAKNREGERDIIGTLNFYNATGRFS